jgi:hypothetical protein
VKRAAKNLGERYADALLAHEKAQSKLRRAFRACERTHGALKRLEKQLDQAHRLPESS